MRRADAEVASGKPLSAGELRVLKMICAGMHTDDIARELHVSIKTIHSYRILIRTKTGAENSVQMLLWALRAGVITLEDIGVESPAHVFVSAAVFNVPEITAKVVEGAIREIASRVVLTK